MAKRQNKRKIRKSDYPGLKRITLADGSRSWVWQGRIYKSLNDLPLLKS